MTSDGTPTRGACADGVHEQCLHMTGMQARLLRRPSTPAMTILLCTCTCACHAPCPLTGRPSATGTEWPAQCTCPMAADIQHRRARSTQRQRRLKETAQQAKGAGVRDPAEIERRLTAVFLDQGESPPAGLTVMSRLTAAAAAPRGTRGLRVLAMAGRGVVTSVRWAWQTGRDADGARPKVRRGHLAVAGCSVVGTALSLGAWRGGSPTRLPLLMAAAVAWLAATVTGTVVTLLAHLGMVEERDEATTGS